MRGYRATAGSDKLQIMRGEFHRHTEIRGMAAATARSSTRIVI